MAGSLREVRPGVWFLRVDMGRDPVTGRRRQKTRTFEGTKRAAKRDLADLVSEYGGQRPDANSVTFAQLLEKWLELKQSVGRSPTTLHEYRRIIDQRLVPVLGDVPLSKLTVRDFDQLFTSMRQPGAAKKARNGEKKPALSGGSIKQAQAVARGALNQAKRWGWIDTNPAALATVPTPRRRRATPPTMPQLAQIVQDIHERDPDIERFLWVAAALGSRRGELAGLRWRHVDFAKREIHIERSIVDVDGELIDKETKTYEDRRVEIDDDTVAVLREHHTVVLDRLRKGAGPKAKVKPSAYVFSRDPAGVVPLKPDLVTGAWRRAAERAGVEGTRLHDLRHLSASLLLAKGMDPATVANRLGHATPATTTAVYAHMMPGRGRDAADLLGQLLHPNRPA